MNTHGPSDDRELQFHLEMLTRRYIDEGFDPDAARAKAQARMGDLEISRTSRQLIEHRHELRRGRLDWFRGWGRDVQQAYRVLRRAPGFIALTVIMLGLGTGASTAVFSVVDAVIIRSTFDRVGSVARVTTRRQDGETTGISRDQFTRLAASPPAGVEAIGLHEIASPIVTRVDVPKRTQTVCLSADMPTVIGTQPMRGRWFTPEEAQPGAAVVALVGYSFWRTTLAGDPQVLGRVIDLDDVPVTIIGVMPPGFDGPYPRLFREIWVPYAPLSGRTPFGCRPMAESAAPLVRVRSDATFARASASIGAAIGSTSVELSSYQDDLVGDMRSVFAALVGAVVAVVLIAFVNVTNLGLERLASRRREVAVRLALGATRGRIIRETLAEHVLIALAGAAVGIGIAIVGFDVLLTLLPASLPNVDAIALNTRVLMTTVSLALIGGVTAGCLSAWHVSTTVAGSSLAGGDRSHTDTLPVMRRALVSAEIALGVLLMVRTFLTLRPHNPGFEAAGKHIVLVRMPPRTPMPERLQFIDGMRAQLLARPGIRAVAATTSVPWRRSGAVLPTIVAGAKANINAGAVTPNYFDMMGVAVLRGRGLSEDDHAAAPAVALVNEAFVERWLPGTEPLGQVLTMGANPPVSLSVVGVVANTRSVGGDTRVRPFVYTPLAQNAGANNPFLMLDVDETVAAELPATVRAAVAMVRPGLLVDEVERLLDEMNAEVAYPRLGAWLFGSFAALAVLLAAVGLAATLAWTVAQRRREIGIRVALGATTGQVKQLILGQTALMAAAGIGVGLLGAAWSTRLIADWLYGVGPLDSWTFVACACFMFAVSLAAAWVPAQRAGGVDPAITLRGDAS